MSRIAPLEPPYADPIQTQFENIMGAGVTPLLLFRTLATNARAWRKFRAGSLLDGEVLTLRDREIVIDRTCARAGCEYEWGVHIAIFARAARFSEAEIAATLQVPSNPSAWAPNEAVLIATVDALHERATLSDAEFTALKAHYSDDQVMEILLLAGFYRTVAYISNGLGLPMETDAAQFASYAG